MAGHFGCRASDLLDGDAERFRIDHAVWMEGVGRQKEHADEQQRKLDALKRRGR